MEPAKPCFESLCGRILSAVALGFALAAIAAAPAQASSHREALAVLNEPCADNTDTYAWVSNGSHDKLYLIMNFNPLHEPGQGNQGLRACNGYRYEFHIGKGHEPQGRGGLPRRVHEHAQARSASQSDGSSGRRQRAALAAHRRHRDHDGHAHRDRTRKTSGRRRPRRGSSGPPEQPRSADRSARSTVSAPSRVTTPGIPRAAKWVSTIRRSSTPSSTRFRTAGGSSPASSTIPISSTRRESSTSST